MSSSQRRHRPFIWIGHLRDQDGALAAAFVVDERDYPDHTESEAVLREARRELSRRGVALELEGTQVPTQGPRYPLPTWQEYRERLSEIGEDDSP